MSTHVVNEFHALPDRADDVMNLLIELSPISRTRLGCQAISLRRNQDDPTNIVGDTRWATRQDYDNYLAWRTDSGYTAQFEEMLAQPMSIRYFDEVQRLVAATPLLRCTRGVPACCMGRRRVAWAGDQKFQFAGI